MKKSIAVFALLLLSPILNAQDSIGFLEEIVTLRQRLLDEKKSFHADGEASMSALHDPMIALLHAKIDLQVAKKNSGAVGRLLAELVKLEEAKQTIVDRIFREGLSGSTDVMKQRIAVLQAKARLAKHQEGKAVKSKAVE